MGLIGLWLVATGLVAGAIALGWTAFVNRPTGPLGSRHRRALEEDRIVREACADLDAEYRELTRH